MVWARPHSCSNIMAASTVALTSSWWIRRSATWRFCRHLARAACSRKSHSKWRWQWQPAANSTYTALAIPGIYIIGTSMP